MRRPIHQQVFDVIRNGILDGKYPPGSKLPSEAVLVRQFETSRITVGRALRDLQQQGWIERRAGSGSYVRRQATASAATAEGLAFGLLIPELGQTQIFEAICRGIAQSRQNMGHALLWGNAGTPAELCRQFVARNVDGVFFAPVEWGPDRDAVNAGILDAFREARIPVVLLDRDVVPYPGRSDWDLVGIDNRRAGYIVTKHLLDRGAKRVCFWAKPDSAPTVDARIAGYREASGDRAVCADPADRDAVRRVVTGDLVDGIVCANDRTAGQLIGTLTALGFRVPTDVRVAGIDDLPFAPLLTPALTTVRQPCREIGEASLSAMLERVAWPDRAPREILLRCELVVRDSTGD